MTHANVMYTLLSFSRLTAVEQAHLFVYYDEEAGNQIFVLHLEVEYAADSLFTFLH